MSPLIPDPAPHPEGMQQRILDELGITTGPGFLGIPMFDGFTAEESADYGGLAHVTLIFKVDREQVERIVNGNEER